MAFSKHKHSAESMTPCDSIHSKLFAIR